MAVSHVPLELLADLGRVLGSRSSFSGSRKRCRSKEMAQEVQDKGSLSESYRKLDLGSGHGGAITAGVVGTSGSCSHQQRPRGWTAITISHAG